MAALVVGWASWTGSVDAAQNGRTGAHDCLRTPCDPNWNIDGDALDYAIRELLISWPQRVFELRLQCTMITRATRGILSHTC
jgi:hypothetical protein